MASLLLPPHRDHKLVAAVARAMNSHLSSDAPIVVGLSGGMDSVALLDAMIPLAEKRKFAACHVNHGISGRALQWEKFCRELCESRGVRFFVRRIAAADSCSANGMTEQRARRERMRAFSELPAAAVFVAHHADDQAETLLFRMLRGAGVRGMGAMRECAPLPGAATMVLVRPWLNIVRGEVLEYARGRRLRWLEDEDNFNLLRRRNFLRHRAMPMLREYFPECARVLSASAARFSAAAELLSALADSDEQNAGDIFNGLCIAHFRSAGAMRLQNWMHVRLSEVGARFGERGLAEAARQILQNQRGELTIPFGQWSFRCWKNRLYFDSLPTPPKSFCVPVAANVRRLELPQLGGILAAESVADGGLCEDKIGGGGFVVRLQKGGERILSGGRMRLVSDVLRAAGIPPWRRRRLPLLFAGDSLAALPNAATADNFRAMPPKNGRRYTMEWSPPAGLANSSFAGENSAGKKESENGGGFSEFGEKW